MPDEPDAGLIAMFPAALVVAVAAGAVLLFRVPMVDVMAGSASFEFQDIGYGLLIGLSTGAVFANMRF